MASKQTHAQEWTNLEAADVLEAFALVAPDMATVFPHLGYQITLRDGDDRKVNTLRPDWSKLRAVVGPRRVRKPTYVPRKEYVYYALRHEPTGHVVLLGEVVPFGEVECTIGVWSNMTFDETTNKLFRIGAFADEGIPAAAFLEPLRALLREFL
jgi:hypothetical protein